MAPMATRAQARRALAYGAALIALAALSWAWQWYRSPDPTGPAASTAPASREERRLQGIATVFDADTIGVQGARLRLQGIDAPEYAQACGTSGHEWPCGRDAIAALRKHVAGRMVDCLIVGTDRYQRGLALCRMRGERDVDDDLNRWLVRNGWAVSFGDDYIVEESLAERERAGLWRSAFQRPSLWRRAHPRDGS